MTQIIKKSMGVLLLFFDKFHRDNQKKIIEKVMTGGNDRNKHELFSWHKWTEKNDRKSHDTTQITNNQK